MLGLFFFPNLASFIMIRKQVKIDFCLFYKANPQGTLLPSRFDNFYLRRGIPSEHKELHCTVQEVRTCGCIKSMDIMKNGSLKLLQITSNPST